MNSHSRYEQWVVLVADKIADRRTQVRADNCQLTAKFLAHSVTVSAMSRAPAEQRIISSQCEYDSMRLTVSQQRCLLTADSPGPAAASHPGNWVISWICVCICFSFVFVFVFGVFVF